VEGEGNNERRKHHEVSNAKGEEQTREIHAHKKGGAGHNHGEQREGPARMKYRRRHRHSPNLRASRLHASPTAAVHCDRIAVECVLMLLLTRQLSLFELGLSFGHLRRCLERVRIVQT